MVVLEDDDPCPVCSRDHDCEHQIFWCALLDNDWGGALRDATRALDRQLAAALLEVVVAQVPVRGASFELECLLTEVGAGFRDAAAPTLDAFPWNQLAGYLLSMGQDTEGIVYATLETDGSCPGSGGSSRFLYAADPEAAVKKLVAMGERDLARLEQERSHGRKRAGAKPSRRS